MKLTNLFDEFQKETVNLNKTRIDLLDASIPALKSFIRDTEWKPKVRTFVEQGSWAHETIIRPVDGGEFDADLLVMVDPVEGWTAAEYVESLGRAFSDSKTYEDKSKTWDYCVTITYAGDRKIDLAPCVVDRRWEGSMEVCNRKGGFELTAPVDYTAWMKERNAYSGNNSFRKVTRLVKYLRDIKQTFTCPSVLLTTLLGNQIHWFDKDTDEFADVPTTLQTLMGRLDDWLRMHPNRPTVMNPKLPSEDFSPLFGTDDQYSNFRTVIARYRKWIDEAHATEGRQESIAAWQKVFGDEFGKASVIKVAADAAADGFARVRGLLSSTAAHLNELVDVVKNYGISVLPLDFSRPPHIRQPTWRQAPNLAAVPVTAEWREHRSSTAGRAIRAGELLPPRGGLHFRAFDTDGSPLPPEFGVQWRITNTGAVAMAKGAGRGGFYVENSSHGRWETLDYRGVHLAEAFVVRRSDDMLVGVSKPFYVVIE
ncbi:SMODS domain-containing nucleotidyltransferase [Bradyrhizobium diazoefficiens]|uniref:SMODS domain-containing nucleotidyltransferase n=1 Tax=Bradyrhizobium diazoefficiens TaxID=1355477 RepID=UPI0027155770|nr:nucleotidyltransferase [Bradyrhizobium diazoefficiens]WLB38005.1 nucleotidyltransferase [Bradyrhizobium diazoefficiens]WLC17110.1 nucleotidyltransferase [Bradyrhizobium diazoefficiens]